MYKLGTDPTRLGSVEDVSGPSVRIKLSEDTASGLLFSAGEGYRVGQVGSFVRIPAGYLDLFGIVSHVGAGAAPGPPDLAPAFGNRWLRAELVGEGSRTKGFQRGISHYPSIGDVAHVVTDSDLAAIYAPGDPRTYVPIGRVASAEAIRAYLDLNKLVARHSAIVGSTGSGKSTTVASLLHLLANGIEFPSSRIVLLDLHGEYTKAFGEKARVFRVGTEKQPGQQQLFVPFWALTAEELMNLTTGVLGGNALAYVLDEITEMKRAALPANQVPKMGSDQITADTPLPFSIHKLWFDLHCLQNATHYEQVGKPQARETWALEVDPTTGKSIDEGSALEIRRPKFKKHKDEKGDTEKIRKSVQENLMRAQTESLEGRLRDPRLSFLFRPGPWSVSESGATEKDLDALLSDWVGSEKPITVLDLSGIPPSVLDDLVGAVLRILYDAMFWGRATNAGGRHRPLLIVLEEAHSYISAQGKNRAGMAARRIAKEGRKYGVGLMLVSQRPAELDATVLAQCGTIVAMRLTNESDRGQVKACASDNLEGLFSMLPILRTGEALVIGEAVGIPVRALIEPPGEGRTPDSDDPLTVRPVGASGGWTEPSHPETYEQLLESWRKQQPVLSGEGQLVTKKESKN